MTLTGLFDSFGTLGIILIILYIYSLMVKASTAEKAQPKDYEQMKRNDAELQRKRNEQKQTQTQTVEQTTTTTTTTTLGQWDSNTTNTQNNLGADSRVNYSDPATSDDAMRHSLDASSAPSSNSDASAPTSD